MKLGKLIDPQFQHALRKLASQDIPLRSAFKLRGTLKSVTDALTGYDEVRHEALKKLGNKKEDGSLDTDEKGNVSLGEENSKKFAEELNTLLDTHVDIGTIKLSELGDKCTLSASELMMLDTLITE